MRNTFNMASKFLADFDPILDAAGGLQCRVEGPSRQVCYAPDFDGEEPQTMAEPLVEPLERSKAWWRLVSSQVEDEIEGAIAELRDDFALDYDEESEVQEDGKK